MEINRSTNIGFKGGFYFKNVDKTTKQNISSLIRKNKRQVFYDLREPNDMFLLTHDSDNWKVADFIKSNKKDFSFFPKISTSLGFQTNESITELITKQARSIITNPNLVKSPIKSSMSLSKAVFTVSKVLGLNIEKPIIKQNDAVLTTVRDNVKERNINIILTKGNSYYVEVKPDSPNMESTFAIFSGRGRFSKICKDIDDRIKFMETFKSLKAENANVLYKYKMS